MLLSDAVETSHIIDFPTLLRPIAVEKPTGNELRTDPIKCAFYYQIKDARAEARTAERMQIQKTEVAGNKADWQIVIKLAITLLTEHSKDLEIAAWLTEALLREYGFAGLRDGFQLIHQLCITYWDALYPQEDEEGVATKLAPLIGINGIETEGTLIVPLAMVPLIAGNSTGSFALWQYQQALEVSRINDPEKQAQRITSGAIDISTIQAAARETAPLFFHKLRNDLIGCLDAFAKLDKWLTDKCGVDAPPTSKIMAQLNACLDCLNDVSRESNNPHENTTETLVETPNHSVEKLTAAVISKPQHTVSTREEALQLLLHVAEFFRRAEPHSPLSYMLERTVRWGRLPLPELLKELVKDDLAWEHLSNLTGITQ